MTLQFLLTHSILLLSLVASAQWMSHPTALHLLKTDIVAPSLRYESIDRRTCSIGISFLKFTGDDIAPNLPLWNHYGPSIECGIDFRNKNYMINKLGYEYYFLFFGGRLNVIHATDFTHHHIGLQPEVGLSVFGVLQINYGYAITQSNAPGGGHILGIGLRWLARSRGQK